MFFSVFLTAAVVVYIIELMSIESVSGRFSLGFHIRMVVAEPTEAAERRFGVCHHGRRCGTAVRHVRHGSRERVVRSHGHPSVRHPDVSGDRLPSGRRVHLRTPVPQGDRAGARLFYDGRLAGLLDGVPDVGANDALVENGVRAVRPGGV